jgi:predicted AlkP superfamily pyrophosphatase or phosphodiesterase
MLVVFSVTLSGCASRASKAPSEKATVVWISVDGLRNDYIARTHAPTFSRLQQEGAFTNGEMPIFPSLTFPNHAAQATGARADRNGIPSNNFYDRANGKSYNLPSESDLYRAEPFWITAKRQGLRVATIDWPMSSGQTGEFKSDYCSVKYDSHRTDRQRLTSVAQVLQNDRSDEPFRLVMTYLSNVDHDGHKFGPDSPEVDRAVLEADATLNDFLASVQKWFDARHPSGGELFVLITTDHGMEPVQTTYSLDQMLGEDLLQGVKVVTSGPTANIYFTGAQPDSHRLELIIQKLVSNPHVSAWRRRDIPGRLHLDDPSRVGDVFVLLPPGCTFNRSASTRPSFNPQLGMHGYDPATCSNMRGSAIIWRYHHPMHGKDLGAVDNTQWHATVARILGIKPSPQSNPSAVFLN